MSSHFLLQGIFPTQGLNRHLLLAAQVALVVKNQPANAGDRRDPGSIPGAGRSAGGGNGNPLQYSCPGTEEPGWLLPQGHTELDTTEAT